jgi:hypothetical protein
MGSSEWSGIEMKISLELPEQGFDSAEDYINEKLVPACSELKALCEGIFQGQVKEEKTIRDCFDEFVPVDTPVVSQGISVVYDPEEHPPSKGDKVRKTMAIVKFGSSQPGQYCEVAVMCDGQILERFRYNGSSTDCGFQITPVPGPNLYSLYGKSLVFGVKPIVESFRIETVYV